MSGPIAAVTLEYRGPGRTIVCVESLLSEGVSRVLILDNSADVGASASVLHKAFDGDARVRIVDGDENLGFAAGVNKALAMLRHEGWAGRVLLVNNDAVVMQGSLGALDQALDEHHGAAMAYPTILHAGKPLALTYYHAGTGRLSQDASSGGMPYVSGCCVLLAVESIRTELFDETFFMYGEDVELSARFRRNGLHAVHAPDALVIHEGSSGSGLNTVFYETHMIAAHVILASRLADSRGRRVLHMAGRAVFLSARAILRALRYRSWIPFRGLVQGWRIGRAALRSHGELPAFSAAEGATRPRTR